MLESHRSGAATLGAVARVATALAALARVAIALAAVARTAIALGAVVLVAVGFAAVGFAASAPAAAASLDAAEPIAPTLAPRIVWRDGLALHAGDQVEIRWTTPGPEVDELEIQLSLDGGRSWPLRVSPELDTRAGRWLWRVPNFSSGEARLRLRYDLAGRETEGESTAPFTIESAGAREAGLGGGESAEVLEGDWWSGERALDLPGAREALAPAADAVLMRTVGQPLGIQNRTPTLIDPEVQHARPAPCGPLRVLSECRSGGAPPPFVPLRI